MQLYLVYVAIIDNVKLKYTMIYLCFCYINYYVSAGALKHSSHPVVYQVSMSSSCKRKNGKTMYMGKDH